MFLPVGRIDPMKDPGASCLSSLSGVVIASRENGTKSCQRRQQQQEHTRQTTDHPRNKKMSPSTTLETERISKNDIKGNYYNKSNQLKQG
jgi:hypothetical protein